METKRFLSVDEIVKSFTEKITRKLQRNDSDSDSDKSTESMMEDDKSLEQLEFNCIL